jgi:hypothetical protein
MKALNFDLKPFPGSASVPQINITGKVVRQIDTLTIGYELRGDLSQIHLPSPSIAIEKPNPLFPTREGGKPLYCEEREQNVLHSAENCYLPTRKQELWQTTCFEFFLGIQNSPQYWEFNLSPNGDWNIYRFTGYRQGMVEEDKITSLPFQVHRESHLFRLDLSLDLTPIVAPETELYLGITTVIQPQVGEIGYWALKHCGTQPDFHLRDSFVPLSS